MHNHSDHSHDHHHHHHHGDNHSHGIADHLHSHTKEEDKGADLIALGSQFIEGFMQAKDKAAYLKIAEIPLEMEDSEGGKPLKLVDVQIKTGWQVGTATPSFGSNELSYLPYPGEMITEHTNMEFIYVSLSRKQKVDLRDILKKRLER